MAYSLAERPSDFVVAVVAAFASGTEVSAAPSAVAFVVFEVGLEHTLDSVAWNFVACEA